MPGKYRDVFILHDMQHLSATETAHLLRLTIPAEKTQLRRMRLPMREQLAAVFGKRWIERLPLLEGKEVMVTCDRVLQKLSNYLDNHVDPHVDPSLRAANRRARQRGHRCYRSAESTGKML